MRLGKLIEQKEKNLVEFGFGEVHHGDVFLNSNAVTSLEGAPKEVNGGFYCGYNKLTSLEGAPEKVGGDFYCSHNKLLSLEGAPREVGGDFDCNLNNLTSLEGAPERVGNDFVCYNNKLTSLKGAPEKVGGNFYCANNKLESLKNVHKMIKSVNGFVDVHQNPIKSHVLGLLLIEGITEINIDNQQVEDILNKHLTSKDIFECQDELIDAGFEEYAQL